MRGETPVVVEEPPSLLSTVGMPNALSRSESRLSPRSVVFHPSSAP